MVKPINVTEKKPDSIIINPCFIPYSCDGEGCTGGSCHGICHND